jgi:hypothetical protein
LKEKASAKKKRKFFRFSAKFRRILFDVREERGGAKINAPRRTRLRIGRED